MHGRSAGSGVGVALQEGSGEGRRAGSVLPAPRVVAFDPGASPLPAGSRPAGQVCRLREAQDTRWCWRATCFPSILRLVGQRSAGRRPPQDALQHGGPRLTGSGPCSLGRNAQPFRFWQRHSSLVHPFCLETLPVSLANCEAEVSTSVQQGLRGQIAQRAH